MADFGSMISPTVRLPPRLLAKDLWPQRAENDMEQAQPPEQDWSSDMAQDINTWGQGRDGRPGQLWNSRRDQANTSQDQAWGSPGDSSHGKRDQTWMRGQSRSADGSWVAGRGQVHNQTWNLGKDPEADSQGQEQIYGDQDIDRGPIWRPGGDLNR